MRRLTTWLNLAAATTIVGLVPSIILAQTRTPSDEEKAAGAAAGCAGCLGCGGFGFVILVGIIVLNIALLIWVARDAKGRGMDSGILWMLLVFFTGPLGLLIYIFARPQGAMVMCPHCKNKRLAASAKCPHCGNT
jgi:preprotein translocase subunit Sss1